jgi:hypothetical protein
MIQARLIPGQGYAFLCTNQWQPDRHRPGFTVIYWDQFNTCLRFSTIAKTQMQTIKTTIFLLMPSMLLTDFAFRLMAAAQWIAEILPLTHFLHIICTIVLRCG